MENIIAGNYYKLPISKILDFGVYLDGGESGDILLPMKWVPKGSKPDDELEVFVYYDSSDRIIATTMKPFATLGEFAYLQVKAVNDVGAFLDWGLEKDLLLPYREQKFGIEQGTWVIVYIFADDKGRIAASTNIEKFIDDDTSELQEGQEVDLLLYSATDLGFKVIINNRYEGIIYANEVFQKINKGQKIKGYVKTIRPDRKVDLSLYKTGYLNKIDNLSDKILMELENNNGFLPLNDKSRPEEIYLALGMSKKNFKQSVGKLLKLRLIELDPSGIKKKQD